MRAPLKTAVTSWAPSLNIIIIIYYYYCYVSAIVFFFALPTALL